MQAFELPAAPLREDDGIIRVTGTRVTLESIVAVFERGGTAEEIVQSFPSVGLAGAYAILTYVVSHRADVAAYLERRANEELAERVRVEASSDSAAFRDRLLARQRSLHS
jgi:uncharacterized protein (DUF433 family)